MKASRKPIHAIHAKPDEDRARLVLAFAHEAGGLAQESCFVTEG